MSTHICTQCIYYEDYGIVIKEAIGECSWKDKRGRRKKVVYGIYDKAKCRLFQKSYAIEDQERKNEINASNYHSKAMNRNFYEMDKN